MPASCLLASANSGLQLEIREAFGSAARVDLIATDASTALSSEIIVTAPPEVILVLDAQLPRTANLPPDREEKATLWLLQELRARGIRRAALVITSRPMGISEIDEYCNPDNQAIALPQRRLEASILSGFVLMLRDPPKPSEPTWNVRRSSGAKPRPATIPQCRGLHLHMPNLTSNRGGLAESTTTGRCSFESSSFRR